MPAIETGLLGLPVYEGTKRNMYSAHDQVQEYYHLRTSSALDRIISVVDTVTLLTAGLLEADFTALFYQKENGDGLIPVSFYSAPDVKLADFDLLEEDWFQEIDRGAKVEETFVGLGETHPSDLGPTGQFAQSNGFAGIYQFPTYIDDRLRAVIVACWHQPHKPRHPNMQVLLGYLTKILIDCMTLTDEAQLVADYSLRLSKLMAVFEAPLGEYSFTELMSKLLGFCRQIVPEASVCLFSESSGPEELSGQEVLCDRPVSEAFLNSVLHRIEQACESSPSEAASRESCYDLSRYYADEYTGVVAMDMCPDESLRCSLVAWTECESGFSQSDLNLLSVFAMFAKAEIRDAYMVRRLRKTKRLLEKSSMRMADTEALAALADMTTGVAHDFNNIFGGVVGRLQLMRLKIRDETILSDLSKIESLVLSGAHTIRRIQEFATGAKAEEAQSVDLCRVIGDCLDTDAAGWKKLAGIRGVAVVSELAAQEAIISGCEAELKTVIHKLVENAVEHSPANSTVTVSLRVDDRHFTISITDRGPGIPEEIRQKIFYPFFSTKGTPGAGLGLAMVRGIVTRQGGEVSLGTNEGSGTVFNLAFSHAVKDQDISEITTRTKRTGRLKVLVVDDDDQIREILTDMLTMDGYSATACPDANAALKTINEDSFDILITDLGMPGMSGLDLAGEVHETHPQIPIAMITGWGTQLSEQEVSSRGIRAILSKPFHLKEVKELIQELALC